MGPLIPLFLTSGDVSSGFQNQSQQPYLHLAEAYVMYVPSVNWNSYTKFNHHFTENNYDHNSKSLCFLQTPFLDPTTETYSMDILRIIVHLGGC